MDHKRWQDQGSDPDYRFSMANERTFLAWLRTSLALLAASVAVSQLVPSFDIAGARTALGVVLAATGTAVALFAYRRWAATERAMRMSRRIDYSVILPVLSAALGVVGVLVLVLVIAGPA
jgi:putative membrane protein